LQAAGALAQLAGAQLAQAVSQAMSVLVRDVSHFMTQPALLWQGAAHA
jgi:hypothetical protein